MKDKRNYIKQNIIKKIKTGGRYSVAGKRFYLHRREVDVNFTKKVGVEHASCMSDLLKDGVLVSVGGFLRCV